MLPPPAPIDCGWPHCIHIKTNIDPKNWFLNSKEDVRSSYTLEEAATEFDIQGLELDWTCLAWDADFRFNNSDWEHKKFKGSVWQNVNDKTRQQYLKNAYRVTTGTLAMSREKKGAETRHVQKTYLYIII